jgi:2-oxoisovalerate dehydrogenase E1 component
MVFFGDGASNNGAFHEGINMATVWDLPVVFICENNLYATEVPFAQATRSPNVASRAAAYGLPGIEIDGNDLLVIYDAVGEAVDRARAGQGPTLIECHTYRTRPHAEGMRDTGYRAQEEIDDWKTRDPIARYKQMLLAEDVAVEDDIQAVDAEVSQLVEEAVRFALESPWPDPSTLTSHVYSTQ